jgi:hypothetical protein
MKLICKKKSVARSLCVRLWPILHPGIRPASEAAHKSTFHRLILDLVLQVVAGFL